MYSRSRLHSQTTQCSTHAPHPLHRCTGYGIGQRPRRTCCSGQPLCVGLRRSSACCRRPATCCSGQPLCVGLRLNIGSHCSSRTRCTRSRNGGGCSRHRSGGCIERPPPLTVPTSPSANDMGSDVGHHVDGPAGSHMAPDVPAVELRRLGYRGVGRRLRGCA
jgi:hypothetical protein